MSIVEALRPHSPPTAVYETFERIFDVDAEAGSPMRSYLGFGSDPTAVRRFVQYTLDNIAFSRRTLAAQSVLDAGCGFGLASVVYGLYGATTVCGVDVDAGAIRAFERYRSVLPGDLSERLHLEVGDVVSLPWDDESFDIATSIEALSHYLDVAKALKELRRVLRPGGVLIVSDGNNGLEPLYARMTRRLWKAAEDGPGDRQIGPYWVGRPYRERREAIIREYKPELSSGDVTVLAKATFGLVQDEIRVAADSYERDGVLPTPPRGDRVPVDPDGATQERLFDPYRLAREIASAGFGVRVAGYWGGANGRRLVRVANTALAAASRVTIYAARGFRIAAVKAG